MLSPLIAQILAAQNNIVLLSSVVSVMETKPNDPLSRAALHKIEVVQHLQTLDFAISQKSSPLPTQLLI